MGCEYQSSHSKPYYLSAFKILQPVQIQLAGPIWLLKLVEVNPKCLLLSLSLKGPTLFLMHQAAVEVFGMFLTLGTPRCFLTPHLWSAKSMLFKVAQDLEPVTCDSGLWFDSWLLLFLCCSHLGLTCQSIYHWLNPEKVKHSCSCDVQVERFYHFDATTTQTNEIGCLTFIWCQYSRVQLNEVLVQRFLYPWLSPHIDIFNSLSSSWKRVNLNSSSQTL